MALAKRVQVLMEPEEFRQIAKLAKTKHSSVGELVREAVRAHWLSGGDHAERSAAVQAFLDLPEVELPPWRELKRELEDRRG